MGIANRNVVLERSIAVGGTFGLAIATYQQGGFFYEQRIWLAITTIASLIALVWAERLSAATPVIWVAGALAIWILASEWVRSVSSEANMRIAGGDALAVAIVASAYWVATSLHHARWVRVGISANAAVAGMIGWIGLVRHDFDWAIPDHRIWRAAGTITYANGLGALLVVGLAVAIAEFPANAIDRRWAVRLTDYLVAVLFGSIAVTGSRSAYLATLTVLALAIFRWRQRIAALVCFLAPGAVGGAILAAATYPSWSEDAPASPAQCALIASLAIPAAPFVRWVVERPAVRRVLAAIAASGVRFRAVGIGVAIAIVGGVGAIVGRKLINVLRHPGAAGDRLNEWSSAIEEIGKQPILGHGGGRLNLQWTEAASGETFTVAFAHNEFLQIAGEYGLVGLSLVLIAGTLFWRSARSREVVGWGRFGSSPALILVAASIPALLDFSWHTLVVPVSAAAGLGAVDRSRGRRIDE